MTLPPPRSHPPDHLFPYPTLFRAPGMKARGWGRIVNVSSVFGWRGAADRIDYVTTKTALLGMTRAIAVETARTGITCNAVCPGSVPTPAIMERIGRSSEEHTYELPSLMRNTYAVFCLEKKKK